MCKIEHSLNQSNDTSANRATLAVPTPRAACPPECQSSVNAFSLDQARVGTDLTLFGSNFLPTASTCDPNNFTPAVQFDDSHPGGAISASVRAFSNTEIATRVPNGAKTGRITIFNGKNCSAGSSRDFIVLPTIERTSPTAGGVGTAVTVFGTALYNTPQFAFFDANGREVPANFTKPAPGQLDRIEIAVPAGAVTGKIKVQTKGGGVAFSPNDFVIKASVPQVASVKPAAGAPGTRIIIKAVAGTKFEAIRTVSFLRDKDGIGQERRIILGPDKFAVSGNGNQISCRVPEGAISGKIRVTNDSGSGASEIFRVL